MERVTKNLLAVMAGAMIIPGAQAGIIAQWNFDTSFTGNTVTSAAVPGWNSSALTASQGTMSYYTLSSAQGGASGGAMQFADLTKPASFILQLTPTTVGGSYTFTLTYSSSVDKTLTSTPRNIWEYSKDGGTSWTSLATDNLTTTFQSFSHNVTINGVGTSGVWFRDTIDANNGNRTANFDSFSVDGVSVVPEPAHYALAAFGLIFVGTGARRWYIRRRQRA